MNRAHVILAAAQAVGADIGSLLPRPSVRDRDARSPEFVELLKAEAAAKRERRRFTRERKEAT